MNVKIILAIFLLLHVSITYAIEENPFEVLWVGVYSVSESKRYEEPTSPTGKRGIVKKQHLEQATTRILANLGVKFGINYLIKSLSNEGALKFRVVWKYPSSGLFNPAANKTVYEDEFETKCETGIECIAGQHLIHNWELVPGIWIVEFWIDQRLYVSQSFEVVLP